MALDRAAAGDVIDLAGLGDGLAGTPTHAVYKSVQCLEGEVEFELPNRVTTLRPGKLLCLEGKTPHALRALSDASLL